MLISFYCRIVAIPASSGLVDVYLVWLIVLSSIPGLSSRSCTVKSQKSSAVHSRAFMVLYCHLVDRTDVSSRTDTTMNDTKGISIHSTSNSVRKKALYDGSSTRAIKRRHNNQPTRHKTVCFVVVRSEARLRLKTGTRLQFCNYSRLVCYRSDYSIFVSSGITV
jgi:hypothetical protein